MDPDTIRESIRAFYEAQRERDPEKVAGCFADDGVAHIPVGAPALEEKEERIAFFEGILGFFTFLDIQEEAVFPAGSGAAVKWSAEGSGAGEESVTFEGIDLFEFDAEGRIQILMGYWDPAGMITRLKGRAQTGIRSEGPPG
ncbi:MAG: nuclear transport factor 2 family protein [bacterium]